MQIAILGLGKMGRGLAEKLMGDGHQVVVWNRSPEVLEQQRIEKAEFIVNQKLVIVHSIAELRTTLTAPRIVWSMLPAGEATESVLGEIGQVVDAGDIVIDGGNANFKDTERRYQAFEARGIKFLGIGVSGGVHGLEDGFCLMAGGNQEGYDYIRPLLESLSKPAATYSYFGTGGAGHFVKMVHNGIEYGMMQAIAEGFGVLAKSNYNLDLVNVANTYQEGSIVSSFLVDMVIDALSKDPTLSQTIGRIDANGEAKWTIDTAREVNVSVPIIEQSLAFRTSSQVDRAVQDSFVAKLVQAMRHEFGGHEQKSAEPRPEADQPFAEAAPLPQVSPFQPQQ